MNAEREVVAFADADLADGENAPRPAAKAQEDRGVVKEILCENGQAVEYGQPLFVIE